MVRDPIIKQIGNLSFSAESFVMEMMRQPLAIQERWWAVVKAYIYGMAAYSEYGWFPNNTAEIARECHMIVHQSLGPTPRYNHDAIPLDMYDHMEVD